MPTVFTVVGQHDADPNRLLLVGNDGYYYAYDAVGRTAIVEPTTDWRLDSGQRLPPPKPVVPSVSRRCRAVAVVAILVALALAAMNHGTSLAHAPALVTAGEDVSLLAAPTADAAVLAMVAAGSEIELTGVADGAFLGVFAEGRGGWVNAVLLDAGITTVSVADGAVLHAEPTVEGRVVTTIPSGSTVILTGALVDGFVAAAFAGSAGWLPGLLVVWP